jgi:hypothetical protein
MFAPLWASPRHHFVTSDAVERPVVKLTDEESQSIAQSSNGRVSPARLLLAALAIGPSHRYAAVLVDRCPSELADCYRPAALTVRVVNFLLSFCKAARLGDVVVLKVVEGADRGRC